MDPRPKSSGRRKPDRLQSLGSEWCGWFRWCRLRRSSESSLRVRVGSVFGWFQFKILMSEDGASPSGSDAESCPTTVPIGWFSSMVLAESVIAPGASCRSRTEMVKLPSEIKPDGSSAQIVRSKETGSASKLRLWVVRMVPLVSTSKKF